MPYKPPKTPTAKLRRKNNREETHPGLLKGTDKTHAITIHVSTQILNEIDSHIPDEGKIQREQFILKALEAYLGRREKRVPGPPPKVTKAISKSTGEIKTGRYEP